MRIMLYAQCALCTLCIMHIMHYAHYALCTLCIYAHYTVKTDPVVAELESVKDSLKAVENELKSKQAGAELCPQCPCQPTSPPPVCSQSALSNRTSSAIMKMKYRN